jgi:virginiamycin B lyase
VRRIGTTILALAAALLAAAAPASADAASSLSSFTSGVTPGATPTDIAAGSDGNLWFTEAADPGRIGRITPAGQVTEFTAGLTPNAQPTSIVAGPDGAMWFSERAAGRIGRIASDGRISEFLVPSAQPFGIATGPDGALYFTDRSDHLGRLTTAGDVTTFDTRNGASPEEIALGPDGNLWFTEKAGVGRLTPGGVVTEFTSGLATSDQPADIATGPDGNLWITNQKKPGALGRVTPLGAVTPFGAGLTPNGQPAGIAAGPDGALWFTESLMPAIGRIDSQGRITEYGLPGAMQPWRIAAGPDGALWVTDRAGGVARLGAAADGQGGGGGSTTTLPAPKLGRQVVVHPVRGTVRVRRANGHGFELLDEDTAIPPGSLVDTRRGAVRLSSALDAAGHTQSGVFSGGVFSVAQSGKGMTDLYLRGGRFARCRSRAVVAEAARSKATTVRSLWGPDRSGRFRTHGRDSVATVRGTSWLTTDRCDGTLTVVKAGAVLVRERWTHRSFVVSAGDRHLARRHG